VRNALTSARLRSLFVYLAIVAVVFVGALTVGFVFAHEPQRETVSITVRETPLTPPSGRTVFGVIGTIADGSLVLVGDEQSTVVEMPAGVPVDELTRLPAGRPPFRAGTIVNLGTADTSTGFIVTGIVAVDGTTP
jgi:hypothetical protein